MKKLLFLFILWLIHSFSYSDWFLVIPEASEDDDIKEQVQNVWSEWWEVMKNYRECSDDLSLWWQFASWCMNWDTLIDFAAHLVNFMSQLGLVIWAVMIIYSGYIYASSVFTGNSTKWADPVKKAIIGILIIIFSYSLMRIVTFMFL